jgi:hypothetical protein
MIVIGIDGNIIEDADGVSVVRNTWPSESTSQSETQCLTPSVMPSTAEPVQELSEFIAEHAPLLLVPKPPF